MCGERMPPGLTINEFGIETIVVEAVDALAEVEPGVDDVIFLCVKSQELPRRAGRLAASTRAPLFCWQNGIRNEPLAAQTFADTYGGTGLSRCAVRRRRSHRPAGRTLVLGRYPDGADDRALAVAQDPEAAGLRSPFSSRSWLRNGRS